MLPYPTAPTRTDADRDPAPADYASLHHNNDSSYWQQQQHYAVNTAHNPHWPHQMHEDPAPHAPTYDSPPPRNSSYIEDAISEECDHHHHYGHEAVYEQQYAYPQVNYVLPPYDFREYPVPDPDPQYQYADTAPQTQYQVAAAAYGTNSDAPHAQTYPAHFQKLDLYSPSDYEQLHSPPGLYSSPEQSFADSTGYDSDYPAAARIFAYPQISNVPVSTSSELGNALQEIPRVEPPVEQQPVVPSQRAASPPMGRLPFPEEVQDQMTPPPPTSPPRSRNPPPVPPPSRQGGFHLVQDPAAYPEFSMLRKRRPAPLSIPPSSSRAGLASPLSLSSSFSASPVPTTPTSTMHLVSVSPGSAPHRKGQAVLKLPHPKRPRKKPALACLFCRERKIACGPPIPGSDDQSCNQCARRQRKCEYPTESRRGQHKRNPRPAPAEADTPPPVAFASPAHTAA